jgi:hypothetical protein
LLPLQLGFFCHCSWLLPLQLGGPSLLFLQRWGFSVALHFLTNQRASQQSAQRFLPLQLVRLLSSQLGGPILAVLQGWGFSVAFHFLTNQRESRMVI